MLYIRRKDDHSIVKAFGFGDSGSLGEFDTDIYEEIIADDLPEDYTIEPITPSLAVQLESILIDALTSNPGVLSDSQVGDVFVLKSGISEMLRFGQVNAAKAKIEEFTVPEELENVKTQMLSLFD